MSCYLNVARFLVANIEIDGFRFAQWPGGRQFLRVESDRLSDCVRYCNEKKIEWLSITPAYDYNLNDLDFLRDCRHVVGIHLMCRFSDMGGLYCLPRLRFLSAVCQHEIDLSAISSLEDLSTDWNPHIDKGLFSSKSLSRLWLRYYKPKERNLTQIAALANLESLSIILSPIVSIRGVESLSKLKQLELAYCRRLEDIRPLEETPGILEELELDHCKKVDLTRLQLLRKLRKLMLSEMGTIPSLSFIRSMPKMKFLSFVGTNVLDGDMTPCFNLEYAGFLMKRHYSHTFEQVREAIEKRIARPAPDQGASRAIASKSG